MSALIKISLHKLNYTKKQTKNTKYPKETGIIVQDSFIKRATGYIAQLQEFGDSLFKLFQTKDFNFEQIAKLIKHKNPTIELKSLEDLEFFKSNKNLKAYSMPDYKEDFTLNKITIYAPRKIKNINDLSSIVHEYAHCIQEINNGIYSDLKEITNGNLTHARIINNISSIIFSEIEKMKNISIFRKAQKITNSKTNETEALIKALGYNNLKEFSAELNQYFSILLKQILENNQEMFNSLKKEFPLLNDSKKFKEIIIQHCIKKAQMESEAYSIQKQFIETHKKNSLNIENKINPVFYNLLIKAFKSF